MDFILEFEKKAIVASAMAQEATGAPVSFHPGRDPEAPFEIMRIFAEAGGNTKKSICSHLESKYKYRESSFNMAFGDLEKLVL